MLLKRTIKNVIDKTQIFLTIFQKREKKRTKKIIKILKFKIKTIKIK